MKSSSSTSLLLLLLTFVAVKTASAQESDLVLEIWVQTSTCNNCGMTDLGTLHVKVCGSADCCWTENLPGDFDEGQLEYFSGAQIKHCDRFNVGSFGREDTTMSVTLYHSGTDGGQFDSVDVYTVTGNRYSCTMPAQLIDNEEFLQATECHFVF